MFTYRVFTQDGEELGEATYVRLIGPGEEIHLVRGRRYRVCKVVVFADNRSPLVGLLEVEPAA